MRLDAPLPIVRHLDQRAVFGERFAQRRADVGVVVNDQDAARHDAHENNTPCANPLAALSQVAATRAASEPSPL
jgi:hypothetical protein